MDSMVAVEVRTVWWLWRYGQYGGCGGTDSMVVVEVWTVWWLWRYGQYGGCGGTDRMVAVDVRVAQSADGHQSDGRVMMLGQ